MRNAAMIRTTWCLLHFAIFTHASTAHNNPNVWTGGCAYPNPQTGEPPYSASQSTRKLGVRFPFLNISGICFGVESHALDDTTTILTFDPPVDSSLYTVRVTEHSVNLELKDRASWNEVIDWYTVSKKPLFLISISFDGKPAIQVGQVATLVSDNELYLLSKAEMPHKPKLALHAEVLEFEGNGFRPKNMFEVNKALKAGQQLYEPTFTVFGLAPQDYTLHLASNNKVQLKLTPGKQWTANVGEGVSIAAMHGGTLSFEPEESRSHCFHLKVMDAAGHTNCTGLQVRTTSHDPVVSGSAPRSSLYAEQLVIHGVHLGSQVRLRFAWPPSYAWYSDAQLALTGSQHCLGVGSLDAAGSLLSPHSGGRYNLAIKQQGFVGCSASPAVSGYPCEHAFDGVDTTSWALRHSTPAGSPEEEGGWIAVHFDRAYTVTSVALQQRSTAGRMQRIMLRFSEGSVMELALKDSP